MARAPPHDYDPCVPPKTTHTNGSAAVLEPAVKAPKPAYSLADPEALGQLEALVREAGSAVARQLVFEITETSEMVSLHATRRFMQALITFPWAISMAAKRVVVPLRL